MVVQVFQKKREVQMTLTAEELAKITGHGTVEAMMKKYSMSGMKGACTDFCSPLGLKLEYQKNP